LRDRPDSTGTIGTITVPTLLLAGDEDVLTPPSELDRMAAALPPATTRQVEVVTGAGHVSCLERPAAVTLAIREFLDRLDPPLS
jgi:pimeloyl-ACP methyl ester carboxylesterase